MKMLLLKIFSWVTSKLALSLMKDLGEDEITNEIPTIALQDLDEPLTFEVTVNKNFKINIFEPSLHDSYIRLMLQNLSDGGEIPEDDYLEIDDIVFSVKPGFPIEGAEKI